MPSPFIVGLTLAGLGFVAGCGDERYSRDERLVRDLTSELRDAAQSFLISGGKVAIPQPLVDPAVQDSVAPIRDGILRFHQHESRLPVSLAELIDRDLIEVSDLKPPGRSLPWIYVPKTATQYELISLP